jgi:hypothetical protein
MTTETEDKSMTDLFGEKIHEVPPAEIIRFPTLNYSPHSLSPLEKTWLGLLITTIQPKVIIETGVWRGRTTRFMYEFVALNNLSAVIYGFDLPEIIDELVSKDIFFTSKPEIQLIHGTLPSSLKAWLNESNHMIDLALIDASHNYGSVYQELSLLGARLSPNGYIFCHDYGDAYSKYEGVTCAINEFCRYYGFEVLPLRSMVPGPNDHFRCQAAILRRPVVCPANRRLYYWRKNLLNRYPLVGSLWARIRNLISSKL